MKKAVVKSSLFLVLLYMGAIMLKKALTNTEKEVDVLARTIWGEARGEGSTGMQAVANVITNRVNGAAWYGATFEGVCKKPYQFSCWNANDPNASKCATVTENDRYFVQAKTLAEIAVAGNLRDITGGANHYHTKGVKPSWADASKITAEIGNHIFYKL
jgi:spore germination cell wall hydrolase CwlJ-like protein